MDYAGWMSRAQVAEALGVSGEYVAILARSGRLEFVQTAVGRLYSPHSVDAAREAGVGRMRKRVGSA